MRTNYLLLAFSLVFPGSIRAGVLPNNTVIEGKTLSEWSEDWWKWAFSIPTNQNPLFDLDGSRVDTAQPNSSVFFLAGVITVSGTATRHFTIPQNKYLFFPLLNVYSDNVFTIPPLTIEELREQNEAYISSVSEVHLSVDGVQMTNLFSHRAISPVFSFDYEFPDNLESFGAGQTILGLVDPIVSDGWWVMIEPLAPGSHTLNFGGTFSSQIDFTLDITDYVTVANASPENQVAALEEQVQASRIANGHKKALLASLSAAEKSFAAGRIQAAINELFAFTKKVQAQVAKKDSALAKQLIAAAQQIIDAAKTK